MAEARLTQDGCQRIAETTMQSIDSRNAETVLGNFEVPLNEIAVDEKTGMRFRRIVHALPVGTDVVTLLVVVTPEPRLVRPARRFRWLADFVTAYRDGSMGRSYQVLRRDPT
jgi:hypothetical protein